MKILFVDDNDSAREISKVYFENEGYDLDLAASGEEAKYLINNFDYDIVVTDEQMPNGISGMELAEWIYDNYPEIRVVFASVYWERALKLGQPFIKKPLTPTKLFDHINGEEAA